jgi:GAF domain-containing protein
MTLAERARALVGDERDPIANAANLAALLYGELPDLNWAGFYFVRDGELVLGPFQGKPACVRIARGRGVCGTAWERAETIVVPDVHAFPGHIACDSASNAEIVVPLVAEGGRVVGVLDLDSPRHDRFDESDRALVEDLAALYVAASDIA